MALTTRSSFYFGHEVTLNTLYIDFNEGGPELTAILNPGYYSPTEFALEVQRAMLAAGALTYAVGFNRTTRKITISANSTFALLKSSGSHADNLLYDLLGYTGGDLTGASTYTFTGTSGYEYRPQFFLLDWVSQDQRQEAVESNITTTGSGIVEIVRFGLQKFLEFTIDFINNDFRNSDSLIESNQTGFEDAVLFMQEITKKGHIEFMMDRDDVNSYLTIMLESTASNRQGIGYRLVEKIGQGLVNYYTTGLLTWRLIE